MLQNVRAFLGLSPDGSDSDGFHYGVGEDDTSGLFIDADGQGDDTSEVSSYTQPSHRRERYESTDDPSLEISYEDESGVMRVDQQDHQGPPIERDVATTRRRDPKRREAKQPASKSRVNPLPVMQLQEARPKIVKPRSFEDAQTVADGFLAEIPIVMNLTSVDQELARRLIDFSSGFCYVVGGEMERIRARVFLLTPPGASLSEEDRRLLASRRYDR